MTTWELIMEFLSNLPTYIIIAQFLLSPFIYIQITIWQEKAKEIELIKNGTWVIYQNQKYYEKMSKEYSMLKIEDINAFHQMIDEDRPDFKDILTSWVDQN